MKTELNTKTSEPNAGTNTALEFLFDLPIVSMTPENQQEVLKDIVRLLAKHLKANCGYLLIRNGLCEPKEQLTVLTTYRPNKDINENKFSKTLIGKTLQNNQGQLVHNAMNNKEYFGDPSFQTYNIKSAICVPLKTSRCPMGVMYFDSPEECEWNNQDLKLLEALAGFIGLAIEKNQLSQDKQKNNRLIAAGHASLHISHSIKNILQLIGGAVEVIDFGLRTDQIHRVKRSWDILKPNLERIKKFTLEMLDFSKERQIELGPCQFNRIVQDAIDSLRAQLKQKETNLHIRVDSKMPMVELDGERVHQMVVNLILNALDAVDEQTGVVEVKTKYLINDGAVGLTVSDNGPGVDEENKENIFLPYHSTKSKKRLKTGLGLAIAKQIVDQHKGQIEVESESGKGSTFKVLLPCRIIQGDS